MNPFTQHTLDILNKALAYDPAAISKLVHFRVKLNDDLLAADDLPLVCNTEGEMGLLGVLNGVLNDAGARIAAVVNISDPDDCTIQRFVAIHPTDPTKNPE